MTPTGTMFFHYSGLGHEITVDAVDMLLQRFGPLDEEVIPAVCLSPDVNCSLGKECVEADNEAGFACE